MYAAGSFGGSVSLYSEDESGTVGHLEGVEGGGVTQVSDLPPSQTQKSMTTATLFLNMS
jgi:hypothetical protein